MVKVPVTNYKEGYLYKLAVLAGRDPGKADESNQKIDGQDPQSSPNQRGTDTRTIIGCAMAVLGRVVSRGRGMRVSEEGRCRDRLMRSLLTVFDASSYCREQPT